MSLRRLAVSDLTIRGERAFRAVVPYTTLKKRLVTDGYTFLVPPAGSRHAHHDRALFLNLGWWSTADGSDVLMDDTIDADALAHAAWHHVVRRALTTGAPPTIAALFLGEAIASAFDLYVVGRLLRAAPRSDYLATQIPAMSAAAMDAGVSEDDIGTLFDTVAANPELAFERLRQLLFDASLALLAAPDVDTAVTTLDRFADHPYVGLLHHYELSTWVLFARAYGAATPVDDTAYLCDRALRTAPVALDWLTDRWL